METPKNNEEANSNTPTDGNPDGSTTVKPTDATVVLDPVTPQENAVAPVDTKVDPTQQEAVTDHDDTKWLDAYKDFEDQYKPAETDKALADMLSVHGLNIAEVNKEILTTGDLSQETVDKLKQVLPAAVVDMQVQNIKDATELAQLRNRYASDQIQSRSNDVLEIFGGAEGFAAFNKWSSTGGLKSNEIDAINKVLSDDSIPHEIRVATMQTYANRMMADPSVPNEPLLEGGPNTFSLPKVSALNAQEYRDIMKTDKYKTDSTYAAQVDAQRRTGMQQEGNGTTTNAHNLPAYMRNMGR